MPLSILHPSSLLPAEARQWIRILCQSLLSSLGLSDLGLGLQVTHMLTQPSLYIPSTPTPPLLTLSFAPAFT